jgi:hypothetical protein
MQSSKHSSPDTQSPSELEKGEQSFGAVEDDHASDEKQQDAAAGPGTPSENEKAPMSEINISDWHGDDDPDNPYNCMFLLLTFCSEIMH